MNVIGQFAYIIVVILHRTCTYMQVTCTCVHVHVHWFIKCQSPLRTLGCLDVVLNIINYKNYRNISPNKPLQFCRAELGLKSWPEYRQSSINFTFIRIQATLIVTYFPAADPRMWIVQTASISVCHFESNKVWLGYNWHHFVAAVLHVPCTN